jgi:hypothetical protein
LKGELQGSFRAEVTRLVMWMVGTVIAVATVLVALLAVVLR